MHLGPLFESLLAVPSPSRREGALAAEVKAFCAARDLAVEEDDAARPLEGQVGNLLVRLPATAAGPTLLFCAHLDTVESGEAPVAWRWDEGAGAYAATGETVLGADDKCGVAVLLGLLDRLAAEPGAPRGEVRAVFTVCEEIELLGSDAMPPAWLRGVDAAFALDHSDPAEIVRAAPAKEVLRFTVHGVAGHASAPERRINAAHLLARVAAHLPSGRLDEISTCNLGVLRSGTAVNVIPGTGYAEYEIRSHDEARLRFYADRTEGIIDDTVQNARILPFGQDEVRQALVEIDRERCYGAYRLEDDVAPVVLARRGITAAGLAPRLTEGQGGSDANVLNRRGVPCCVLGCGMHGAHSTRERADLAEMTTALEVLARLVRGAAE
jgi:tripeptide aminopeptidase